MAKFCANQKQPNDGSKVKFSYYRFWFDRCDIRLACNVPFRFTETADLGVEISINDYNAR